ncbi:hypothetical protein ILUMI_22960 [Ignelater luminosus]|uniref:Uncharacterized protein n=1 Tax=Ignelater luminosus TaxID=2038154 RepID=A0A8K0CES6_IGNLU|nr:hypothetical protein ILUMI_22960 [Ignelater luminosus]
MELGSTGGRILHFASSEKSTIARTKKRNRQIATILNSSDRIATQKEEKQGKKKNSVCISKKKMRKIRLGQFSDSGSDGQVSADSNRKSPECIIREIPGDSKDYASSDDEDEASICRNAATIYGDEDC